MKTKKAVSLAVLLLFVAGIVYVAIYVRNHGFSAREEPTWYEKWLARNARRIATPSGAKELKNPNAVSEAGMSEAREHFVEHCSFCHAIDGRGNTTFGRNMYPKVPDMTDGETQGLADGELFYIINNGVRFTGMPAFGSEDSHESIWDLVALIRRLPQLSPEELKQMQELAGEESLEEAAERDAQGADEKSSQDKKVDEKKDPHAGMPGMKKGTPKRKLAKPHSHDPGTKPHEQ